MKVLVCNIGWMDRYQGQNEADALVGGGSSVDVTRFGVEVCNFAPVEGMVYGSFKPPGYRINIQRLGSEVGAGYVSNVLVVWTAKSPNRGTVVVGWYKNATVFEHYQELSPRSKIHDENKVRGFWISASSEDAVLLHPWSRDFRIPRMKRGGMGRSNIWYADGEDSKYFKDGLINLTLRPQLNEDVLVKSSFNHLRILALTPQGPVSHYSQSDLIKKDLRNIPVWFGTNRKAVEVDGKIGFDSNFSSDTTYGRLLVNVPERHKPAQLGSSWWVRLRKGDDRLKIVTVAVAKEEKFWTNLKKRLSTSIEGERNSLLIFLHGYNVSFEDAALRTAQLSYDLRIAPACFFSWPSKGRTIDYMADENTIQSSIGAITDFLRKAIRCVAETGTVVHIIGHSMGNRGLVPALEDLCRDSGLELPVVENVVFAAPDVDANFFNSAMKKMGNLVANKTLYASQRDKAVWISSALHKSNRIGYLPPVFVAQGLDTIDASGVEETFLGHSYIANVRSLLNDLGGMLKSGLAPYQRTGIEKARNEFGEYYWRLT